MITLMNKNEDQPMFLGDRDSYYKDFETDDLPKGEKGKRGDGESDGFSALFKNSTENNNSGAVVGQTNNDKPITNNDSGNNTPTKVPCC